MNKIGKKLYQQQLLSFKVVITVKTKFKFDPKSIIHGQAKITIDLHRKTQKSIRRCEKVYSEEVEKWKSNVQKDTNEFATIREQPSEQ